MLSAELIVCTSCNTCENTLFALVKSPDERASLRVLRELINALELLVDVDAVEALALSEAIVSDGCKCCMICANMLCALVVSPDEIAFSNALRSLANGLEFVLLLDVDEVVDFVLPVELTSCTSCSSCENALWALERLPASRACISVFSSAVIVSQLLVEVVDVVSEIVDLLLDDERDSELNNL